MSSTPLLRRRLTLLSGLVLLAGALVAEAQEAAHTRTLGFLSSGEPPSTGQRASSDPHSALLARLRSLGYSEGANLRFERRWAAGRLDRLPALAAELVALDVDVMIAAGNPAVDAARRATSTTRRQRQDGEESAPGDPLVTAAAGGSGRRSLRRKRGPSLLF